VKKLKVTRIVTSSGVSPYNEKYYPQFASIEEAAEYERNQPVEEWADFFFEESNVDSVQSFVEIVEEND
jgi:flagellar basal body rod protein FlgG